MTLGAAAMALCVLLLPLASSLSLAAPPSCAREASVEALVACLAARMPRAGAGYVPPDAQARAEWRVLVASMLRGACADAALGPALSGVYRVVPFRAAGEEHCVALEADGSRRGWGTLVVRAGWTRDLSVQVVHPIADVGTEHQGAALYAATGARSLVLAGAHRAATSEPCECQGAPASDAAHASAHFVQVAVEEMDRLDRLARGALLALQLHGMAADSCDAVDAYLTDGTSRPPAEDGAVRRLQRALLDVRPAWSVVAPGDGPRCHLHGSTNVQGRLLNGVPAQEVCARPAESATGRFVHVEQDPAMREAAAWAAAVRAAVPASSRHAG
ncbi:MAG TPA: hypothetical protein VM582_00315 [Candidatus Thermoplasmatota archaeon]|nr:hypothetical protein [Candidatus Thermoplasmatota archaeon]